LTRRQDRWDVEVKGAVVGNLLKSEIEKPEQDANASATAAPLRQPRTIHFLVADSPISKYSSHTSQTQGRSRKTGRGFGKEDFEQ
jgi:hypothetical protein